MMNGGLFMGLVSLLFLALIVGGVWLLIRAIRSPDDRTRSGAPGASTGIGSSTALSILEERYARGEIDQDEFEERRRSLRE